MSAATRDLEAANQQLSAEKSMLVNRVGEAYTDSRSTFSSPLKRRF